MGSILVLLIVVGAVALIYKMVNHKEVAPEQVAEPAKAPSKKELPKCGCGRSSTGYCVGLHKLSDAEWAISDKNPNRVAVAPVVVTADTPSAAVEAVPTPKKARAAKPKKATETAEKPKKPKAKKAK
jgi:CDGSH-type Zn-finger protein